MSSNQTLHVSFYFCRFIHIGRFILICKLILGRTGTFTDAHEGPSIWMTGEVMMI